jgi:hypothetical protein
VAPNRDRAYLYYLVRGKKLSLLQREVPQLKHVSTAKQHGFTDVSHYLFEKAGGGRADSTRQSLLWLELHNIIADTEACYQVRLIDVAANLSRGMQLSHAASGATY